MVKNSSKRTKGKLKGIFPYKFIIKDTLIYEGSVPDFKYFSNCTLDEYLEYVSEVEDISGKGKWNSRYETIEYLNNDIIVLYEIMVKFAKLIYDKFQVNITKIRTYSGLSLLIYTACFYDEKKTPIYVTKGKLDQEIRKSYYGGTVDLVENYTES